MFTAVLLGGACAQAPRSTIPWPLPALSAPPIARTAQTSRVDQGAAAVEPARASVSRDSDGDGFADNVDRCLVSAETVNGHNDDDGCPDEIPKIFVAELRPHRYARPEMENLARTGQPSARLRSRLGEIAAQMRAKPDLLLMIVWHLDSDGRPEYSRSYDVRAAGAARMYLVEHEGIAALRIETRGAGQDEPLDTNKSAAGRSKNRRVEFTLSVRGPSP